MLWCGFMQLVAKRPVSPHVFEINDREMHYKFPINALTSVTNRFTGVALSFGEDAAFPVSAGHVVPDRISAFVFNVFSTGNPSVSHESPPVTCHISHSL